MDELLDVIAKDLGAEAPCDLLGVSKTVVLMVTREVHANSVGVFRCTRTDDVIHADLILDRTHLDDDEVPILEEYLNTKGVVWNPEALAAEYQAQSESPTPISTTPRRPDQ